MEKRKEKRSEVGIKEPLPPHGRLASDLSVLKPISGRKENKAEPRKWSD